MNFLTACRRPLLAGVATLSLTSAPAQELTGPASVREKLEPLLKGKVLQLVSQGESAAAEFRIGVQFKGMVSDAVRAGGQEFLSLRYADSGAAIALSGPGWLAAPSAERPGWLEILSGCESGFMLDAANGFVNFSLLGIAADSSYDGRMGVTMRSFMEPILAGKGGTNLKASAAAGIWRLQIVEADGSTSALEIDPAARWPFRAFAAVRPGESESIFTFAPGPEAVQAWKEITLEKVYALGLPVRVIHTAPVQWLKAKKEVLEPNDMELEKLKRPLTQPFTRLMAAVGKGEADTWPAEMKVAAARLGTLLPPALTTTLKAPPLLERADGAAVGAPRHPLPGDAPVTVPVVLKDGLSPFIEVDINGKKHRFLVDTGATASVISSGAAVNATGWKESFTHSLEDGAGNQATPRQRTIESLQIGSCKIGPIDMVEGDTGPRIHPSCSGVIGCDILAQHPFTLDWQARTLTFHPRASFRPPGGGKEAKLTLLNECPAVEGNLPGWGRLSVLLDTGYSGQLMLECEPEDRSVLEGLRHWRMLTTAALGTTVSRAYAWPAGRPLELPFATIPDLSCIQVREKPETKREAVAGTGWMRHFRLTFDLAGRRLWAEPAPHRFTMPADPNQPDEFGHSPLCTAIASGEAANVEKLLTAGAVVAVDQTGRHPAGDALEDGDTALALRLLKLDTTGTWKKSGMLFKAVQAGNAEVVDWLLKEGIDRSLNDGILCTAVQHGEEAIARRLLAAGYTFEHAGCHAGRTAIRAGRPEFLSWMLKEEPALSNRFLRIKDSSGPQKISLLMIAAELGDVECVKVLLAAGADPLQPDPDNPQTTALAGAAIAGHAEIIPLLTAAVPRQKLVALKGISSPLLQAWKHPACMRALLKAGVPPNSGAGHLNPLVRLALVRVLAPDEMQQSVSLRDLSESAMALIEAGADIRLTVTMEHGVTANLVDLFASSGLVEPLRLLLEKGLPPDGHVSSAASAAESGEVETLRLLLAAGADATRRGKPDGVSPLHVAVSNGHTPIVRELLAHKADAREVLKGGKTLLHLAAAYNDPYLLQILTDAGAAVSAADEDDRTPLHVAIERRTLLAVRFLLSRGAKVNGSGYSPATAAEYLRPKYPELQDLIEAASKKEAESEEKKK